MQCMRHCGENAFVKMTNPLSRHVCLPKWGRYTGKHCGYTGGEISEKSENHITNEENIRAGNRVLLFFYQAGLSFF